MAQKAGTVRNGIYRRGKSWYALWKVDGVQHRKSFGPNKDHAEMFLAELKKQIAVGKITDDFSGLEKLVAPRSRKTFALAAKEYMEERANLKPSTLARYKSILSVYLLPEFGECCLNEISESNCAKFLAKISKLEVKPPANKKIKQKTGKKLSPVTCNRVMELLRFILDQSARRGEISNSPTKNVRKLQEPRAKVEPLTEAELDLVLSKINEHFRPLFTALAFTGARPNELIALRWGDIDWRRKEISISKGLVRGHEGLPKTAASERTIPMVPRVESALNEIKGDEVVNIDGYVFVTKDGAPIIRGLDQVWNVALKRAGIKHRPSYQLRHTFASQCLLKGLSPGYVAKLLGHTTLETIYRHYARWIDDSSREQEKILRGEVGQSTRANKLSVVRK